MLISVNKSAHIISLWGSKLKYNPNGCIVCIVEFSIFCARAYELNEFRLTYSNCTVTL